MNPESHAQAASVRRERSRVASGEPYRTLFAYTSALQAFVQERSRATLSAPAQIWCMTCDMRLCRLHGVSGVPASFREALDVTESMQRCCREALRQPE